MAMPTVDDIYTYAKEGKWNAMQIRTALICKVINQDQYDELIEIINTPKTATTKKKK